MWCERCQAEVACQAGPDNQHLQCATCGAEMPTAVASKPTRDPRELLEKWAREDSFDIVMPADAPKSEAATPVATSRKSATKPPQHLRRAVPTPLARNDRLPAVTNRDVTNGRPPEVPTLPTT